MPPRRFSRYEFTAAVRDGQGRLLLTEREPIRFRALPDNILHVVREGDTLFVLAARYYRPKPRAAGFWWVIADFQPDPILDPTLTLRIGRELVIPSLVTLDTIILLAERGRFV